VPATPTRVTIAALRVDAAVDAVGVGRGGALRVPEDADRLGWWIGSAMPGAGRGTVVITGHVDTVADGPGALFTLEKLPMGARIEVRTTDGVVAYRAVARRSYTKRRLPGDLFRTDTTSRLVLITCGGAFSDGAYSHNVVLYAEPLR
jgi:sortase (surface protein transpeptidase)